METSRKVLAAARKLGYRPKLPPRIRKQRGSRLVATVTGGVANPFSVAALQYFTRALQANPYRVLRVWVNNQPQPRQRASKARELTGRCDRELAEGAVEVGGEGAGRRSHADRLVQSTTPQPLGRAGLFRWRRGPAATVDLARRGAMPDALCCANDLMAIGTLDAL